MATTSRHRAPVRSRHHGGDGVSAKPASYHRQELIAAASGAVLVVVIGVLSGWAHYSLSNANPASPRAASAAPATGVAEPLTSSQPGGQLQGWLTQAEPSIDELIVARRAVTAAAAAGDVTATGAACRSADASVAGAQRHLPSPDPELNIALQQAIDNYRVGLRHCVVGVQNRDGGEIAYAASYLDQGNAELRAGLAIIEKDLRDTQPRDPSVLTV
ncbi:hypothetical protein [Mycobacterium servetii]|uniref:Alanine and proline rich membrane protein n=1 Tax=Mycobacterium servetii TaxID=3237418 RepID=A0ABV4C4E4_9MYCO